MAFVFPRHYRLAAGLSLALLAVSTPAVAQEVRSSDIAATVPSVGAVEAVSPLIPGERLPSGDLFVLGTVTTRHNGPYRLQVRLSEPFSDRGRQHALHVRVPSGSLVSLGTSDWVTVAVGPGGTGQINPVEYLVVWGQTGRRTAAVAIQVPVTYRVVPP